MSDDFGDDWRARANHRALTSNKQCNNCIMMRDTCLNGDIVDDIELAIEMLKEADSFACQALSMYAHKVDMFDTRKCDNGLSLFEATYQHQQKLRIVVKRLLEDLKTRNRY